MFKKIKNVVSRLLSQSTGCRILIVHCQKQSLTKMVVFCPSFSRSRILLSWYQFTAVSPVFIVLSLHHKALRRHTYPAKLAWNCAITWPNSDSGISWLLLESTQMHYPTRTTEKKLNALLIFYEQVESNLSYDLTQWFQKEREGGWHRRGKESPSSCVRWPGRAS